MKKSKFIVIGLLLMTIPLFNLFIDYYGDWLWFKNLDYSSVFITNLVAEVLSFLLFFALFIIFAGINVFYAHNTDFKHNSYVSFSAKDIRQKILPYYEGKSLLWGWIGIVFFFALIMGSYASGYWIDFLKFIHPSSFNFAEPIFGKDAGFYLFTLPVYQLLDSWYITMVVITSVFVLFSYYMNDALTQKDEDVTLTQRQFSHLALLAGFFMLGILGYYFLQLYNLLYSSNGVAYGASYVDVHAQIPAYWTIIVMTTLLTLSLFLYPLYKKFRVVFIILFLWLVTLVGYVWVYPSLIETYIVKPNELQKEMPYIANNIKFTSKAYGLDKIKVKPFNVDDNINYNDIMQNHHTIENIRLWDRRPLMQTYKQLQEMRLYYDFSNIEVDRYHFKKYTEVAVAMRELPMSEIPYKAQTWVNQHLIYTHGYGVVMNPVNEILPNGMPNLIVKDIPPVSSVPLKLTQMGIYYGQDTDQYVYVNTMAKEFDYPKGDDNVYTHYKGHGGVQTDSLFKRFVYAWKFSDINLLFTSYTTPKSRLMFYRNVTQRAATIAPFLAYDGQPYAVVGENGKLYWIQDAYTTSNMFPYSEPISKNPIKRGVNYIQNSVKIVVDAYNGDVTFYAINPKDPLLQTYEKIYPKLFKPYEEMPKYMQKHIRYPTDLFNIQVKIYNAYHMKDPKVFYNQEDYWQIPNVVYRGGQQKMFPYYIIMRLEKTKNEEYILMLPLTPSKKDNMVAWMCARCDAPHYGELIVYTLPKDKLIYGPMQIEARINQKPEISSELTLWGQQGSRVIKGNQLVIPIKNSFIYVEPVYLQSEQGQIPELKRVIVAFKDKIAMRKTLDEALQAVFHVSLEQNSVIQKIKGKNKSSSILSQNATKALQHYNKALQFLQQKDWVGFGKEMQEVQSILSKMSNKSEF